MENLWRPRFRELKVKIIYPDAVPKWGKPNSSVQELGDAHSPKNFNKEVQSELDGAILRLLGREVLGALYKHLRDQYDVTADEVPYRLETVFHVLYDVLDEPGVQTIQMVTAKRLYDKFGLTFAYVDYFRLQDYVKQAKEVLATLWN